MYMPRKAEFDKARDQAQRERPCQSRPDSWISIGDAVANVLARLTGERETAA